MIGKTISHYKIIEKLGEGGMGEVYLAEDVKLDRKVAIKFLPQHLTKDKDNVERFEREAKAAASLNHPNIVTIHEIAEEDDQTFIVMEYVEGRTLRDVITSNSQFPIPNSSDIIAQIADGLSKAHQAGIVHRDIKPENIIIDKDARVKILDFGLAKLKGVSKLTKESSTLGTVHYMSPEQIQGKDVDHRSDIWSVGVLLYELLTGKPPFKGEYESSVHYAILNEEPELLIADTLSVFEQIVKTCIKKEPNNRYQHLEDLLGDLDQLHDELKIELPSKTELMPTMKNNKLQKILIGALIVLIVVVGYLVIDRFLLDEKTEQETITETHWENSIAVLPFENISNDPDQEYFCDGMTEQIITNLSKINRLKVIGRTSVMSYKNTDKKLPEIGKELNVSYILEGSIRKYGNSIRVTAQLINTEDGSHLWADDFDRELEHVFEVQDDVSEAIASNLIATLSPQEITEIKSNRPSNTEAYEYYMKGLHFHINKFLGATGSMDDFNKSEQMLKKAIELDPNYAPSYAALTDLYNTYYNTRAQNEDEKKKYLDLQEKYIEIAFNLDPNSADVNSIMGYVQWAKGEIEKAYESYKKAFLIQPNLWQSHFSLGEFYENRGFNQLAIKYFTKTIELNPLYPLPYYRRSIMFSDLGELEKAEIDLQKVLEIDPNHRWAISSYGYLLIILKKYDKAEKIISRREQLYPESSGNLALRAYLLAANGEKDKALEIDLSVRSKFRLSLILKMKEEVIQYLNEDFERVKNSQESGYLWFINYPLCEFLHSDPRFQEIVAKHKELYEENLAKYGDIDI